MQNFLPIWVGLILFLSNSTALGTRIGDVNGDGEINLLDVAPFVDILTMGAYQFESDINQDGEVNLLDIAPFVDLLNGIETTPNYVPLYDASTKLEPETTIQTSEALITRIGDRVRDRHAREDEFQAYDHYLQFYWEQRTVEIEIIDRVAIGGNSITVNTYSIIPLGVRDFRAFFRGLNTPAEYFHNVGMTQVAPTQYTTTLTFNAKEGRAIQFGDRMEFEFSPFLANPTNGRTNYYGTAFLYIVGQGVVPWEGIGPIQDSFPLPQSTWLGGKTTLHQQYSNEPDNLFKQMSTNLSPVNTQPFVLGRRLHHTHFGNGQHSEQPNPTFTQQIGKLGPTYIATSCVACHENNGRGGLPNLGNLMLQSTVRVGADRCGTPHPQHVRRRVGSCRP
ncbi:MAG: di-heme oxidoredictase family protein, partial [Planctomycetota bacterium]